VVPFARLRERGGVFRRIGVAGHPRHAAMRSIIDDVRRAAEGHGGELFVEEQLTEHAPGTRLLGAADLDLLVTLGGDGTMLRGAQHGRRLVDAGAGRQPRTSRLHDIGGPG
jgi:NAD kinase